MVQKHRAALRTQVHPVAGSPLPPLPPAAEGPAYWRWAPREAPVLPGLEAALGERVRGGGRALTSATRRPVPKEAEVSLGDVCVS